MPSLSYPHHICIYGAEIWRFTPECKIGHIFVNIANNDPGTLFAWAKLQKWGIVQILKKVPFLPIQNGRPQLHKQYSHVH